MIKNFQQVINEYYSGKNRSVWREAGPKKARYYKIYRNLLLNPGEKIDYKNPGIYWSRQKLGKLFQNPLKDRYLLTAKVHSSDVDWKNSGIDEPDEHEIIVKKRAPSLKILSTRKMPKTKSKILLAMAKSLRKGKK